MKTWEMIKKLSENPELKFKTINDKYTAGISKVSGLMSLTYHNNDGSRPSNPDHNFRLLSVNGCLADEWELVSEPVDFMTAVNSGKWIKHEKWDNFYKLDSALKVLSEKYPNISREMINGKWYIED